MRSEYLAKIFSSDGVTLKRILSNRYFRRYPTWSEKINSGQGAITIDLLLNPEDFGYETTIDFDCVIELYIANDFNPNGKLIWKGIIDVIHPYANTAASGVIVGAIGNASTLTLDYYTSASLFEFTKNDTVENVFKDIIDNHRSSESLAIVNYDGSSVGTTGVNINHEFSNTTFHDAIDQVVAYAGGGWYWFIDADGIATLKEKSATADHIFVVGSDVEYSAPKNSKKTFNAVRIVRNGGTATTYTNVVSGRRIRRKIINDSNIQDLGTADARGNTFLDENDDDKNKATFVLNNSYDIYSVKPGQTCKLQNISGGGFFGDNMQIVNIQNNGDKLIIDVEESDNDLVVDLKELISA